MKEIKYFILSSLLLSILFLTLVSAAVSEVSPAAGTNHTGSVLMNCTYVNVTDTTNIIEANTSFYTNKTGTWTKETVTSFGYSIDAFWGTFALTSAMDTANIAFNCTAGNATKVVASGAPLTGITFDSTNPVSTVKAQSLYVDFMTNVQVECSGTDTIDSSPVMTRTLTKPGTDTLSITTTPYIITKGDLNTLGRYTYTCLSTDYTGNTHSLDATFTVQEYEDGVIKIDDIQIQRANTNLYLIIAGALLVIIIIFILLYLTGSKKK